MLLMQRGTAEERKHNVKDCVYAYNKSTYTRQITMDNCLVCVADAERKG